MATFHMMVGLVGSGKSTIAATIAEMYDAVILEADGVREQLYGDASVQGDNNAIFEMMQKNAENYLRQGKSVVYDATNINYKHRMATIQRISKFASHKIAWVVMTDIKECKARNASRERTVPEYVIDRMWKSFTMPQYFEGWDEINIHFSYNAMDYMLTPYLREISNFVQDNPHHSMTLGDHTRKVIEGVGHTQLLRHVALLHDNGKRFTKSFRNARGEPSDIAHFYGHENVGAYEAAFFLDAAGYAKDEVIYGCGLIQLHMRPYGIEGNTKAHDKLAGLIGRIMYTDLMVLNQADRNGK
jgi:predicted kinase